MKKYLVLLLIVVVAAPVFAAGGAGDGSIPWNTIYRQIINFAAFFLLMFFLLRKKLPATLKAQRDQYFSMVEDSQKNLKAAEANRDDIKNRLEKLELTYSDSIKRAKDESEASANSKIESTRSQVAKMIDQTKNDFESSQNMLWNQIKDSLITDSIEMARNDISKDVDGSTLKKLQNMFVSKVNMGAARNGQRS